MKHSPGKFVCVCVCESWGLNVWLCKCEASMLSLSPIPVFQVTLRYRCLGVDLCVSEV